MIIFNSNVESDWKGVYKYWKSAFKLAMIEFFPPNSRALLPTLPTNYPDGSHFAKKGSHFAQNTTTNPCSLLSRHTLLPGQGYVGEQNTPQPTPKQPFSWPELESGQNELQSGQFGPQLGKMFEKWANFFLEVDKKTYS